MQNSNKKGFTLLELLIVIGIIAILSVVVILVLNPAETLKKSRDTQRFSDLATLKTALGLYLTTITSPDLDAAIANHCIADSNTAAQVSYSYYETGPTSCTANIAEGADATTVGSAAFSTTDSCRYTADAATASLVNGTGWIPVDLTAIIGGSPIANFPLDPTNTIATPSTPVSTDLVYRYTCQGAAAGAKPDNVFEINARLESDAYGPGSTTDDKSAKDGGDNTAYYEVGSSTRLLGTGANY